MKILKGHSYRATKDLFMVSGRKAYLKGDIYFSDRDNYLTDDMDIRCNHEIPSDESNGNWIHYFEDVTLNSKNNQENRETIEISYENQLTIIEMACKDWKPILAKEFGYTIAMKEPITITKERFGEYIKASTNLQLERFKNMFPDYFKKPLPDIKPGTLVYVKSSTAGWLIRYFSHFEEDGRCSCFNSQLKGGNTAPWEEYSLTNPLL